MLYRALFFMIIALGSFGYIVFQPIWNYSSETLTCSLLFLLGWVSAALAAGCYEK